MVRQDEIEWIDLGTVKTFYRKYIIYVYVIKSLLGGNEPTDGLSFWVDGFPSPVIELHRPFTYTFNVRAGADHPLYITTCPKGAYASKTVAERKEHKSFAGHSSGYASTILTAPF